jgi:hypothetical protein
VQLQERYCLRAYNSTCNRSDSFVHVWLSFSSSFNIITRSLETDTQYCNAVTPVRYALLPSLTTQQHLEMTLSRAQFDRLTDAHVAAALAPCSAALAQAGVSSDKVKAVLLVGGCR